MTFEDLPDHWNELPLTDPTMTADAVDLVLSDRDRAACSLLVLLCDDDFVPLQPIVIGEVDWNCSARERRKGFSWLKDVPVGGVVVAISAMHQLPTTMARRWLRTAQAELRDGPTLLGFYTAAVGEEPRAVEQPVADEIAS
ncbi:hypothetical protein ACQB6R_03835 [Propionibacteriaceae bacterium G1746]